MRCTGPLQATRRLGAASKAPRDLKRCTCLRPLTLPLTPQKLRELLVECWSGDPNKRPSFDVVTERLETVMEGLGPRKASSAHAGAQRVGGGGCCAHQ